MIFSKTRITKALIRLRGCAGLTAALLFANLRRQVFLCHGPFDFIKPNQSKVYQVFTFHLRPIWAGRKKKKAMESCLLNEFDCLIIYLLGLVIQLIMTCKTYSHGRPLLVRYSYIIGH